MLWCPAPRFFDHNIGIHGVGAYYSDRLLGPAFGGHGKVILEGPVLCIGDAEPAGDISSGIVRAGAVPLIETDAHWG